MIALLAIAQVFRRTGNEISKKNDQRMTCRKNHADCTSSVSKSTFDTNVYRFMGRMPVPLSLKPLLLLLLFMLSTSLAYRLGLSVTSQTDGFMPLMHGGLCNVLVSCSEVS